VRSKLAKEKKNIKIIPEELNHWLVDQSVN
jgi:hypothetical protein